jgi:hypothetical protein
VQVRFRNDGGKRYLRAEAHLVYATSGRDATKVTFNWTDSTGTHTESHPADAGGAAGWDLATGREVQTRWVEFQPVAR